MGKYVSAYQGVKRDTKKEKKYVSAYSSAEKNKNGIPGAVGYAVGRAGVDFIRVGEGALDAALVPVDLMTGNVEKAKSRFMDSPVDKMREKLNEQYNPGKGMQVVGDIAGGIGQSVGYGLISAIPYAGKPIMYSSIIEQGISSAAEKTEDVGLKEIAYGATTGALEGALETHLGAGVQGAKSIGSAILKKSGKEVVKSAAKTGGKGMVKTVLAETAKGAAGEFAEEAISEAVDPALQRWFGIDKDARADLGSILYAGAIGGVSGGMVSVGPAVANYKSAVSAGRYLQNNKLDEDLIKRAKYTLSGFEIANERAEAMKVEKPAGDVTETAEQKKARKAADRQAKYISKQSAELADKISKNVNAYEQMRADPTMADSDATAAVLGELRGNLFLAAQSFEVDTIEAFMRDSSEDMRQIYVDVINEQLAEDGKSERYTLADFDADKDQIRRRLAGELMYEELAMIAKANANGDQSPTEAAGEAQDLWAGIAEDADFEALGATGEAERALMQAARIQGVPNASVGEMLNQFRKGTALTPAEFAEGWAEGTQTYGRFGFDTKDAKGTAFGRMETEAREAAMKYGREGAEAETRKREEAAKAKKKPAAKAEAEGKEESEKTSKKETEGKVIRGKGLDVQKLSDEQYTAYKAAEILSKALGTDIVIEASMDSVAGRVTNGFYSRSTNSIHININAMRNGKNIAVYTLGHEVTHYVREWSHAKYKILSDFVMDKMGGDAKTLIDEKVSLLRSIEKYKDLTVPELNDLAAEEVVADGMELILTDGKVLEELAHTDRSIWQKVKAWISNIISKIKKYYGELSGASKTAQVLRETMDSLDEIERLFTEAVQEAGERTRTAEYGVEIDEASGTALFSVQDAPKNEAEVNAAVDRLVKSLGVSEERARHWVENEMSLSALILREDMFEYAHKKADRRLAAIVKNSDYKQGTLDFSNICRKRRQYTKMMERLQRAFPNRLFTAEDFALIRDILMDEDIEVACGLCYVEDRRQNEGYIATNFREAVQSWRAGNKTTFRDSKSETEVAYSKGAAKAMDMLGNDSYVPTIADLTTVDGMEELGKAHPDVLRAWKAFNNSRGMQSSRLVTAEAEYQRQILKYNKARVKTINDLGGLRIFSFSDFEEFHLIDIIQAVQDCAAMGIKIQFYTKVPSFAYLMKDTGAKGNMSLIPKGKLGYHMEGSRVVLDYDNVEGIDTSNEYFKMLSRDNPNIGTVLVGINETQIKAAMADSFIDYIIPFHSGQSGIVRQIKKIDAWENYKDVQTEKWLTKAEEGEKRGSPGVNIYTDVLQAAEKEGRPITNERQFVEKFLQVCADKGVKPRFWEFLDTDADGKYVYTKGYYKLLLDFKMFDKNGQILPQEVVVPEFDSELLTELTEKYVEAERVEDTKNTEAFNRAFDQILDRVINRNDPIYRTIKQPKLAPAVPNVKAVEAIKRADRMYSLGEDTGDRDFTYKELVAKGDLTGIVIDKNQQVPLLANRNIDVQSVLNTVRSKCESVEMKGGAIAYYVNVPDIGRNVRLTSDGITHGFKAKKDNPNGMITARATLVLPEILKNSIEVNRLKPRGNIDIPFSRVLMGTVGMEDDTGNTGYYAVRSVVEERINQDPVLVSAEIVGNLLGSNAKKITAANLRGVKNNVALRSFRGYLYNIAHFLDDVKGVFDNSFSNDVYQALGTQRNQDDFAQGLLYSLGEAENGDVSENRDLTDRDMLLAMAEKLVGSEEENKIVSNYKAGYDTIREKQNRIDELTDRQRELQSIMFTGTDAKARSDAAKELRTIHEEMNTLLEDVADVDRKLTEIEGMKVIRNLIQRERLAVRDTYQTKYKTMYERKTEAKATTEVRRSVRRLYNRVNRLLFSPTKTRNVPIGMQSIVAEALRAANVDAEAIERLGQLEEQLAKLEQEPVQDLERMADLEQQIAAQEQKVGKIKDQVSMMIEIFEATNDTNADGETRLVFDETVLQKLKDLRTEIGNASIRNMDRKQLQALKDFYDMIWHRIKVANNTLASNRKLEINKVGEQSSREVRDSKALKVLSPKSMELVGAQTARKYIWSQLKPLTAFEVLGSDTFMSLFREVLNGEDVWARDLEEAFDFIQESKKKHKYDDWDMIKRQKVETAQGSVDLSLSEIMSLYAYSFREQAKSHLIGGGFVLDPNATARVQGKKLTLVELERRLNNPTRYTLTEAQIRTLGNYLTDAQRAYVEEVQGYLTGMGEKGNQVSRKLYGIDIFREQHYFPIKVKSEYLESQLGKTGDPKIKNRGMTKEIVPEAKNPLVLQDFMAVAGDHINSMATYHAFVLPVEDLTRVLNFKPTNVKLDADGNPVLDENGMPVADENANVRYDTLKSEIEAKYGAEAVNYIEQLLRDLNGGARRDAAATLMDQGLTAFKRAATMMSLSTIIQQPTSVFRAMAYVDPKWFNGAKKYDYEIVKKYAPVAVMKEIGGFDTGTGMRTTEYLNKKEYKSFKEKLKAIALPESKGGDPAYRAEAFGWLTGKADEITWSYLFGACVNEQAAKLKQPASSEAVLKAAGERFADVVRRTQVYDSTLTRNQMMRSKDTGAKLLTQFGAEPATVVSMIVDGLVRSERGDKTFFRKTAAPIAASIIINAMASSLIYAIRDDDEDKNLLEKYISSLTGEIIEGFNPLEYLPFFRDIMSLFKGYDVERSDMTLIGNLFDQVEMITSSKRSFSDKLFGVSGAVSAFFGVPVTNVYRDAKGIIKTAVNAADPEPVTGRGTGGAVVEGVKSQYSLFFKLFGAQEGNAYELYKAALKDDTSHYERVAARYASATAAEQALRKELRENDKRIAQAAEAKINGELEVFESIIEQIEGEGHFDRNLIIRAINNEVLDIRDDASQATATKDDTVTDEEEEADADEALYSASDLVDALDRGDKDDFADVYDYLVSYKVEQGKTEEQAKSAVRSSVTAKYKKLYLEAWENNDSAEMKRLLALLSEAGIYGTRNETAKTVEKWVRDSAK